MRTLPWRRGERIGEIRDRIWQYLSPAVGHERDLLLEAGRLLQLRDEEALSLGRVHFLLSDEVGALLDQLPRLVRRLATRSEEEEEWSAERVRGSIRWARTLSARLALSAPTLFVTAPAFRAYRTLENRLLNFVLEQTLALSARTGWLERSGPLAEDLRERYARARYWRRARVLQSIPAEEPSARALSRIRAGRRRLRYRSLLAAYELLLGLTRHVDRRRLRDAVEQRALVVADDATLFEVLCTFVLIELLHETGWSSQPLGLFEGGLHLRAMRGGEHLDLWYQQVPSELARVSRYRAVQRIHDFAAVGLLRPDVILRRYAAGRSRWLLVEMKMGGATEGRGRSVEESARAALENLLAYRQDFAAAFEITHEPYGLGVAWGADLEAKSGEVMLATPDRLRSAMSGFLA